MRAKGSQGAPRRFCGLAPLRSPLSRKPFGVIDSEESGA